MRIAIVGSRDYPQLDHVRDFIRQFMSTKDTLISGGARGVDKTAEETADFLGIKKEIYYPNWRNDGRMAGFIRNTLIVEKCDALVAFWHNESRGTEDSINKAKVAGKEVQIIRASNGLITSQFVNSK